MDRKERYYMSSVRLGPKGQIVIPKEARDMFGLQPGDTLVLLADKKKGLALQTAEKLNPMLKKVFAALPEEEVRVTITLVKKSYAVGALEEIVKASAERVEPACPVYKECGGCQLQHLSYKGQL